MSEHIESLQTAINTLTGVAGRYNELSKEIKHIEDLLFDLTHEIENRNFDAFSGFKLARDFHELRQRRRVVKNELAVIQPLYDWYNHNKGIEIELFKVKREMEKCYNKQQNWVYNKRAVEKEVV